MPISPLSYSLIGIILFLLLGWTATYINLKDKYTSEQIAFRDFKEVSMKAEIHAAELSLIAQRQLQDKYDTQLKQLQNEKEDIHKLYASNRNELNSLHQILSSNQNSLDSATTSTTLNYTATLSNLLGECSTMVTDVSAKADEATATAIAYHGLLVENKKIVDSYNQTLQESK